MRLSSHSRAILQALLVTFLWSTSWVLIKQGLREIPPLIFAGLRYAIAFAILLPGLWRHKREIRALTLGQWARLAALGLVFYAATQGGQFLALNYLEAITFSLLLSFTPVLVALAGALTLRESPSRRQWLGIVVVPVGAILYFSPLSLARGYIFGFTLAGLTVCANAAAALLGRSVNRERMASPLVVTAISMGIGASCLLGGGWATQGLPSLSLKGWGIIVWLAVVNTALAFTLWNRTLRVLSAVESSIINNTMLIQIALLAWLFLGESLGSFGIMGLGLTALGTLLVQLNRRSPTESAETGRWGR